MLPPRLLALPFPALLAACSPAPEALCQADIREWLPGPDSAEFLEFSPIGQLEWVDGHADAMAHRLYRDDDYSTITTFFRQQVRRMTIELGEKVHAKGGTFHRFAIRIKSGSGSPVNSTQYCYVAAKECACISREEMDRARRSPAPG